MRINRLVCLCLTCDYLLYDCDYSFFYFNQPIKQHFAAVEREHAHKGHNVVVYMGEEW